MTNSNNTHKLSTGTKVLYGFGDLGIQTLVSALQFWLLFFYTDVAHIDPAIAGMALMVGKLTWDAINDPLFGYLSDRTRSKFGRRRPWMLFGAIPLGLATWLLFAIPEGLVGMKAFLVVLITFLLFDTTHSAVTIGYYALTPELTLDYEERTSLTTIREVFTVLGYVIGAALTKMIADLLQQNLGLTTQQAWSSTGAIYGVLAVVTVLTTALTVKENKHQQFAPAAMPPIKSFLSTFKNKPFMQLMIAQMLSSLAFALLTALLSYYAIYVVKMEAQLTLIMLIMFVFILIFLFPWRYLSNKINKGPSYALGLLIASLALIPAFWYPYHPTPLIFVSAAIVGLGFSAQWVFPWSMLPDVVEYDQLITGERHEGVYYGMWQFLGKFTGALGVAISGWALKGFGYVANQAQQTDQALLGIRLFFSIVPAITLLVSLPILFKYPITRKTHAEVVKKLASREQKPDVE